MAKKAAVGLDIGTSAVRAAELSLGRGHPTLERIAQTGLPAGAVQGGEVVDVDAVAKALKQLWSQAGFGSKKVTLGVSNQKVVVRQVDLPAMPLAEMKSSLRYNVQDFIPMAVEEAILDFQPLDEFTSESGEPMMRMLLVAADKTMVNRALEAVKKAGLDPTAVDLTPFAVLRSVARTDPIGLDGYAEALVDIGASVTNIIIHQAGQPRFVRILLQGGADITDAVAERMGVAAEQAETVKQGLGMRLAGQEPVQQDHPAARIIESAGAQFVEEVRSSLDYYLAQASGIRLRRLILSGGGAQLGNLADRLQQSTRIPVERAAVLGGLSIGKTGLSPEQLQYIEPLAVVPVGLALGVAA